MKVLLVCLGNICRSPMAHGILRDKAKKAGFDMEIDSAGTSDYHAGEPPDARAVASMGNHGHDITDLRARQLKPNDFEHYDHIFVMDEQNLKDARITAATSRNTSKMDYFLGLDSSLKKPFVPDPYFGGDQGFEEVYKMLSSASDLFIERHSAKS